MCRRLKHWYDAVSAAQLSAEQTRKLAASVKDHFDVSLNKGTIQGCPVKNVQ